MPVLVTRDGAIGESHEILLWSDAHVAAERRLFPDAPAARAEVESLCGRFDERLGPPGRRLVYVHMFRQPKLVFAFNDQGVPAWEDATLRAGWPLLKRYVARALGIVPGTEAADESTVFGELDHVAELLSDGRPYLCGERFGAADLTFAALCAPVIVPPGYGVALPAARCARTRHGCARAARARASGRALRARAVRRAAGACRYTRRREIVRTTGGAVPCDDHRMGAKLYVIPGSHACRTASLMLEHKHIPYDTVELPTGLHPFLVRARGRRVTARRSAPLTAPPIASSRSSTGSARSRAAACGRADSDEPCDRPLPRARSTRAGSVPDGPRSQERGRSGAAVG